MILYLIVNSPPHSALSALPVSSSLSRDPALTSPRVCWSGVDLSPARTMASRAALLLCASVVLAAAACTEARDFVVGGADHGWKVPVQPDALNLWSSINRFQIGDNLVFKFDGAADSVLEVTREDYNRCSTASPVAAHHAGAGIVTVPLPRSGPYYFVSGAPGSCGKGERVVVVVLSEKHSRMRHRGFFAPAPAPAESPLAAGLIEGPAAAPAPATGAAGRRAAAGSGALLLGAAVLGAVLVGW
uniref:Phytocyanin domain-containing protein n=1 Tax=Arundo donax TaxID=35708 RepID=A0A0A9H4M7_ARUDO